MRARFALLTSTLTLSACGTSPQTTQLKDAVSAREARWEAEPSVAFRFAGGEGGDVRMYQLPSLEEVTWRFVTPGLVVRDVVGFREDFDEILLVTAAGELVVLDLNSGRPRTADTLVVRAALGPLGTPLFGRSDGTIAQLAGRKVHPLVDSLAGPIEGLWGATRGRALVAAPTPDGRGLLSTAAGQEPEWRALPDGPMAVAPFGDVAAAGTDSGVVVFALGARAATRFAPLDAVPVALAWSSSGHRLYVATGADELVTIERFGLDQLRRQPLPVAVTALRPDPAGRLLLARAALSDSVLVIAPSDSTRPVLTAGGWEDDLPAVAPDGTLLVRRGADVVALGGGALEEAGRAAGGATDRWLIARWDPRRPALQLADEARAAAEREQDQRFYLQVSSTSNLDWAEALARDLRRAGMMSAVLPPDDLWEMYRVVIGPYPDREEAEAIGRTLGMPYWIFTETPEVDVP